MSFERLGRLDTLRRLLVILMVSTWMIRCHEDDFALEAPNSQEPRRDCMTGLRWWLSMQAAKPTGGNGVMLQT